MPLATSYHLKKKGSERGGGGGEARVGARIVLLPAKRELAIFRLEQVAAQLERVGRRSLGRSSAAWARRSLLLLLLRTLHGCAQLLCMAKSVFVCVRSRVFV